MDISRSLTPNLSPGFGTSDATTYPDACKFCRSPSAKTFDVNRRFKLFVLWLVLLAVPLQSVAAVGMRTCDPNHHQAMLSQERSAQRAGALSEHDHHDATAEHDHQASVSQADESGKSVVAEKDHSPIPAKCSACASCCVGAAIAVSSIAVQISQSAEPHTIFNYRSHVGFITDGLERPPRNHLA